MPVAVGIIADSYNTPAGGWTPAQLPTLGAWLDATVASSFTYSTGNDPGDPGNTYVTQWNDLSGLGNHATGNSNAGYHPKRNVTINGLTAVDFSTGYIAQPKSLKFAAIGVAATKPSSYFMVLRPPATLTSNLVMIGSTGQAVQVRVSGTAGAVEYMVASVGTIGISPTGTIAAATPVLIGFTYDASSNYKIRKNRADVATGTVVRAVGTTGVLNLSGSTDTGTASFQGYIGEVVICTTAISGTDVTNLETYLQAKWGTP